MTSCARVSLDLEVRLLLIEQLALHNFSPPTCLIEPDAPRVPRTASATSRHAEANNSLVRLKFRLAPDERCASLLDPTATESSASRLLACFAGQPFGFAIT